MLAANLPQLDFAQMSFFASRRVIGEAAQKERMHSFNARWLFCSLLYWASLGHCSKLRHRPLSNIREEQRQKGHELLHLPPFVYLESPCFFHRTVLLSWIPTRRRPVPAPHMTS